jgi:hypothetical protein
LNNTIQTATDGASEIIISPKCYTYLTEILNAGADAQWVPISRAIEHHVLHTLEKRGLLERAGFVKGRYGTRGKVRLIGDYTRVTCGVSAPQTRRIHVKKMPPAPDGVFQVPQAALPLDRRQVSRFLDETSPTAQREFEKRRQDGLTDVQVIDAVRGLRGDRLIAKLRDIEAQHEMTFDQFLTVKLGFTSELITILGVPECGPDTPEPLVRR